MLGLLRHCLLAVVAGSFVCAAAVSAEVRHVRFTCGGGNSDTHDTRIHFRNLTGQNAINVQSVKIYNASGFVLKDIPAINPFPAGFVRNVPPHGISVFPTSGVFGDQDLPQLTLVFNVAISVNTVPYLVQDIHFILDEGGNTLSRDTQSCFEQKL